MDYKKRVQSAIENYHKSILPKPKKHNDKPEAKFSLQLKKHIESLGWSIDIIEAKANYSETSGRYTNGAVTAGYSDISGNMPNGRAVYVEVKAPGKRSNVSPGQHEFLTRKINTNCFAIVCDSIEYFDRVLMSWQMKLADKELAKNYLLSELPPLAARFKDEDFNLNDE